MPEVKLDDSETVYRRIPSGIPWFEPPDRMSSANFKLSSNDEGLSVFCESKVTVDEILAHESALEGSGVAAATVGEIRRLKSGKQEPLRLDVRLTNRDDDPPGHAEIRGPKLGKLSRSASKALQRLFRWEQLPAG